MGISKILTWPDPSELAAYGAMLYAAEKNDLYRRVSNTVDVSDEMV